MTRSRGLRDDSGATLVIALIVVTAVTLVVGALLTRGAGAELATVRLREATASTYAADAAAQVAINDLRTGHWSGTAPRAWPAYNNPDDGSGCWGANTDTDGNPRNDAVTTLVLPALYPAAGGDGPTSAAVECQPEDATGAQGSPVRITDANKPGNAILTLGAGGENGLLSKANGQGGALRVHGSVWSNSNIRVDAGQLIASTSIQARTGCTPANLLSAQSIDCAAGAVVPDPAYPSDATLAGSGVPALQKPPTSAACGPAGTVVAFEPGYYDDATLLNDITNKNTCRFSTFWFKPGTYYFDFHNNTADPMYDADANSGGGSPLWVVGVGGLIAGDPVGNSLTAPRWPADGNCRNPIDDETTQGVQFIFGGDSRMSVEGDANVEICGSYHADRPPVAVYGLRDDAGTLTLSGLTDASTTDDGDALAPAGPLAISDASPSAGTFAPTGTTTVSAALLDTANDGKTLAWSRPSGGPNNAVVNTITMQGFVPPTPIPAGSIVKEARLIVQSASSGGTAPTAAITPAGPGATALPTITLAPATTLTTQTIILRTAQATAFNALQRQVHDNGYTGASIVYSASRTPGQTAELDSVRLELEYYLPQFRAQTNAGLGAANCLAVIGGGCAMMAVGPSGGSYHGVFYVQGTTYAPSSRLQFNLSNNQAAEVFRFGVISRALDFSTQGNPAFRDAVIQLPDNSPGWGFNGTIVQLTVYVCPGRPTCSAASGTKALKVRVQMWDGDGAPSPGDRQVSVLSWSHQR